MTKVVYGTNPLPPTRIVDKGASTPANLPVGRNPMGGPRGPMGKPMGGMGGPRGAMPAPQVLPTKGIGQMATQAQVDPRIQALQNQAMQQQYAQSTGGARPAQMPFSTGALSANPLAGSAVPLGGVGTGTMSSGMGLMDPNVLQRMKKGGMTASKRADGIAKRGKTRGKMR